MVVIMSEVQPLKLMSVVYVLVITQPVQFVDPQLLIMMVIRIQQLKLEIDVGCKKI